MNPLRPTRREAERDAWEEWLELSWEHRYRLWCRENGLDHEDNANIHAYEKEWEDGFTE